MESLSGYWPRLLAGLMLAGAVLAGCGGDDVTKELGNGGEKKITIGYDQEPDILNGFIVGGNVATNDVIQGILDKPYEIQPDLSIKPQLADGPPRVISRNPFTIEYRLKEDLTFSDGEPLDARDVEFTYNQIMNEDHSIITREGFDKIESFELLDEWTVRMTFSEPYAAWRDLISGPYAYVLPKHVYARKNFNMDLNAEIVGSGPFKLKEWNRGENLILEKNENYWGDEPALDQITFRFISNTGKLNTSLQSGEVQFINPPPDIGLKKKLEGFGDVNVDTGTGSAWEHLAFNTEEVDNLKLRRAVAYGINRERIASEALPGDGKPLNSVLIPEQEPFYTPAWKKYDYDPERARRLVREARSEGASTDITLTTTAGDDLRVKLQKILRKQLEEVGLNVSIDNTAARTFFDEWAPKGEFQMAQWAWLPTPEPNITALFAFDKFPPDGQNYYRWEDQEATGYMQQADVTLDKAERSEALQRAQELMADKVPLIPLYQRPVYYAYDRNLSGPEVNPTVAGPLWNVGAWMFAEGSD